MKKLLAAYGLAVVATAILNIALLAGAVWVVVKVLKHLEVIPM